MRIRTYNKLKKSKNSQDENDFAKLQNFRKLYETDVQGSAYKRLYDPETADKIKSLLKGTDPNARMLVTFGGAHLSECALSLKKQLGNEAWTFVLARNRADMAASELMLANLEAFPGMPNLPFNLDVLLIEEGAAIKRSASPSNPDLAMNCARIGAPP
jgi:hypothetical protein